MSRRKATRIESAVDAARLRTRRDKPAQIYSFYINETFMNVLEHPVPLSVGGNVSFNGVRKCFHDLYERFPECYIGCYDVNSCRQGMMEDFSQASGIREEPVLSPIDDFKKRWEEELKQAEINEWWERSL